MNNPDLTRDRELVELARAMYDAIGQDLTTATLIHKNKALAMADAARTHLGSGYVLPPATEANAERLRDAYRYQQNLRLPIRDALHWLEALHAAFATREPKDDVTKALDAEEKPVRDPVSRDEQREYEALVLQFAAAMAGDDSAEHVINLAVELADQYLEWRKMEREEFKRCKS